MQNLIERLVIMTDREQVQLSELPTFVAAEPEEPAPAHSAALQPAPARGHHRLSLEEMERGEIEAALKRPGWVQARAARELGLTPRQMGYKINKYGLSRPDFT